MKTLYVKRGRRYRLALRDEVLDCAAVYHVAENLDKPAISAPSSTVPLCRALVGGRPSEKFGALWLDARHRLIGAEVLFNGTIDGATVYPREVVKRALEMNAAAAIFTHNHPSGSAEPSDADRAITIKLFKALVLVEIRLLDHLVISDSGYVSLAERGLI